MEEKDKEELLNEVKKAASKGSVSSTIIKTIISCLPTIIIIAIFMILVVPKVNSIQSTINSVFHVDESVDGKDYTINNNGIFGYTAADFSDVIVGESSRVKLLEVYEQEVSDVATITDTGLFNWSAFTKTQLITYKGYVTYVVDLSNLSASNISVDNEKGIVTLSIPHAYMKDINIPENEIEFGDTEHGLLAFGDITMTAEENSELQSQVREKMETKVSENNFEETADRFAKLSVWEIYSPLIKTIASNYSLEVVFED